MSGGNGQTISVCGNVFRLVETIGRGSYGTVHKAINLSTGTAVAVKLIGKDKLRRPHERQSIEKEIETMRVAVEQFENGHPHIVRLLCTKESQHHIFIVLEYCAGGDLAALMKTHNGLTEAQARLYMSQLASGLQFLRSQNVVHRDLKPANLLLSSKNIAAAKLKIADFGFARELQVNSMAESVVGSPLYMAPELLEYKSYDAKADLWSVGIILYEMLVNDHPFLVVDNVHATNHLALRRNIQRYYAKYTTLQLPPSIHVSPACAAMVEALLRVDPQQRMSFESFFTAEFLLPPLPSVEPIDLASSTSATRQALVAEKQPAYDDWAAVSDEYVIVDNEYEDVGRRVLDGQNVLAVALDEKRPEKTSDDKPDEPITQRAPDVVAPAVLSPQLNDDVAVVDDSTSDNVADRQIDASLLPPLAPASGSMDVRPVDTDDDSERKASSAAAAVETTPPAAVDALSDPILAPVDVDAVHTQSPQPPLQATETLIDERKQWNVDDDNRLEELLGICYKSFACGSVGLFVPTPLGDFIAFHEGCPHFYLSRESIAASKRDGRNPPYVLGCIVFIEDYVSSPESNPFQLRDGTQYHIVTVTSLSSSSSPSSTSSSSTSTAANVVLDAMGLRALDAVPEDALPLSQELTSRSPRNVVHHNVTGPSSFASVQSLVSQASPVVVHHHQRISFRSFHISHLALFFLKGGKLPYVAFNDGNAPHYYLANESLHAAMQSGDDKSAPPAYICGEIIFIDSFQATEDFDPYRLPYGTRFHVVTVANPKKT